MVNVNTVSTFICLNVSNILVINDLFLKRNNTLYTQIDTVFSS